MAETAGRVEYELGVNAKGVKTGFDEAGRAARASGRTVESAFGKSATAGIRQADTAAKSLRNTLSSGKLRQGLLQGLGIGGGAIIAAAGVRAVKDAITGTIGAAADFDEAMTKSLAIMGDVSDTMRGEMSDAAREVAKATTVSAVQAADSYFYLASAGLDAEQSIAALPKVAAFAQAGQFDMALATDLLTDAQSALGLTVDDTAENIENMVYVSDALVKANTLANASVQQFAEALTTRGAAALRLYGQDLETGIVLLSAWADQGVKGAEAGTRMDIVLRDLTTTARKNAAAYEDLGVAVFDADGNLRRADDILLDLDSSMAGMSDRTVNATLALLGFTQKSISATASLLGTSSKLRQYRKDLVDFGGTTKDVAAKQLETFNAKVTRMNTALNDVAISLGNRLIPALSDMADVLADDLIPKTDEWLAMWDGAPDLWEVFGFFNTDRMTQAADGIARLTEEYGLNEDAALALADSLKPFLFSGVDVFLYELEQAMKQLTSSSFILTDAWTGIGKAASGATDETTALALALKYLRGNLDEFSDVRPIAAVNKEIARTRREMRAAAKEGNYAKWSRKQAALGELQGELATSKTAKQAFKEQQQRHRQQRQAEKVRRDELKKTAATVAELTATFDASEVTVRRTMRENQGDIGKTRLALAAYELKVTDLAQTYGLTEAQIRRKLERNKGDIGKVTAELERTRKKAEELGKEKPVIKVTADTSAANAKLEATKALLMSLPLEVRIGGGGTGTVLGLPAAGGARKTQHGGYRHRGQLTLVGERGPELRIEPSSALYLDARKTAALLKSSASGGRIAGGITVNISAGAFLGSPLDAERFATQVAPALGRELSRIGA